MDVLLVAVIAALAFWGGAVYGVQQGVDMGRAEAQLRRRLDELGGG